MPSKEQRRFERLLARQEITIRDAFVVFVRDARSDATLKVISDKLERRDVEGALAIVDQYVARLGVVIPEVFVAAGREEIKALAQTRHSAAALHFDPTDPRTAALMRENRLRFVRDFSQEQRRAASRSLAGSYQAGAGSQSAARAIRDSIGLTEAQVAAGQNYARLLAEGSRQALDRVLRDRRHDRTVEGAIERGEPLTVQQIEMMVGRYSQRQLASRAGTIARTEGVSVSNIARREAMAQALEDLDVPRTGVIRTWNATNDDHTRDSHAEMDGQEVGFDEPFTSGLGNKLMYPGDPAAPVEDIVNCRCVVTNRVP